MSLPFLVKIPKVTWKAHNPLSCQALPSGEITSRGPDPSTESGNQGSAVIKPLSAGPAVGGDAEQTGEFQQAYLQNPIFIIID